MGHVAFWRLPRRNIPAVKPGESYRRRYEGFAGETATVLELRRDLLGIPHVMFSLAVEGSDAEHDEEVSRILALDSFREVYRERVR